MLEKDPEKRLGYMPDGQVGGHKKILEHKWFSGINIEKIMQK